MVRKSIEDNRVYYRKYYQENKKRVQAATNRYKKKNPDKVKDWHLKSTFGITFEQKKQMGSSCHICGGTEVLSIDHCHQENRIRGLLCRKCNLALGHFKDRRDLLVKAIEYLDKGFFVFE